MNVSSTTQKCIICIMIFSSILLGCGRKTAKEPVIIDDKISVEGDYVKDQVFSVVDTQKEAEEIARLYGIELTSFEYGVAVYQLTEKQDPLSLIEMGQEKGYPAIQLNHKNTID